MSILNPTHDMILIKEGQKRRDEQESIVYCCVFFLSSMCRIRMTDSMMMTQSIPFPLWKIALSFAFLLLLSDHGSSFTIRTEQQKPRISSGSIGTRNDGIGKQRVSSSRMMALSKPKPKSLLQQRSLTTFPLGATTTGDEQGSIVAERECRFLDEKQLDFIMGYMNKHHGDLFTKLAENFSQIGIEKAKKNAWSGNSYQILSAKIVDINTKSFELDVEIQIRGSDESTVKRFSIDLGKSYCCC